MLQSVKISELPSADTLTEDDLIVVDQPDETKKATLFQVLNHLEDSVEQSTLAVLAQPTGGKKIRLSQGGTVQDAIVTVHVDAFGADPTGTRDSTQAVIDAQNSINAITNSLFVGSERSYARVVFGNGRYIIGDVPIKSGFSYAGQGSFATTILPKAGASWCFKPVGTEPFETSGGSKRLFRAEFEGLHIGCSLVNAFSDYPIPTGVGGIYIAHASYIKMDDIYIRHMDGPGFWAESLWDSEVYDPVS